MLRWRAGGCEVVGLVVLHPRAFVHLEDSANGVKLVELVIPCNKIE